MAALFVPRGTDQVCPPSSIDSKRAGSISAFRGDLSIQFSKGTIAFSSASFPEIVGVYHSKSGGAFPTIAVSIFGSCWSGWPM